MNISTRELAKIKSLQPLEPSLRLLQFEQARHRCFATVGMSGRWLRFQVLRFLIVLLWFGALLYGFLQYDLGLELLWLVPLLAGVALGLSHRYARRRYIAMVSPFIRNS